MRTVQLHAVVRGIPIEAAFTRLADFESYPANCPSVRAVEVWGHDGRLRSRWEAEFRGGLLHWTEEDVVDHATRTITFEQIEGDLDELAGTWRVEPFGEEDCAIAFEARLDL